MPKVTPEDYLPVKLARYEECLNSMTDVMDSYRDGICTKHQLVTYLLNTLTGFQIKQKADPIVIIDVDNTPQSH